MSNSKQKPDLVSVHGAHSRQFCSHATDYLEEIVLEYIQQGFKWVGITEHMPALSDDFLPPEEEAAGLNAYTDQLRFERYFETARALQNKYRDQIDLYVGFETDFWTGYLDYCEQLVEKHRPDYIVGSVHQLHDYLIDGNDADFAAAEVYATAAGAAETEHLFAFHRE